MYTSDHVGSMCVPLSSPQAYDVAPDPITEDGHSHHVPGRSTPSRMAPSSCWSRLLWSLPHGNRQGVPGGTQQRAG